jgi:hypothetical protein
MTNPDRFAATGKADDRFAIIPIPPGPPPADAVMWGDFPTVMQNIEQSHARSDALEQLEVARIKADQIKVMQDVNRGIQVAAFCDSLTHITRRLDSFETRRRERHRRADEERKAEEQRMIEDALSKLPDPDMQTSAWGAEGEPCPSSDDDGDLEVHPPKEKDELEDTKLDNEGDLPTSLTREVPPVTGTSPEFTGAREQTNKNPVAVSLSADSIYPPGSLSTFVLPDPIPR